MFDNNIRYNNINNNYSRNNLCENIVAKLSCLE